MMSLFKKEELERIQELGGWSQFRAIIEVPTDTSKDQLAPFKTAGRINRSHDILTGFLSSRLTTALTRTVRRDKIELHLDFYYDHDIGMGFSNMIKSLPGTIESRLSHRDMEKRMVFMGALALSSVLNDAKVSYYTRTQSVANRLCHISGATVRAYLEETLTFTGDVKADFTQVFLHLWFQFPEAVTYIEADLKRMALLWPPEID